MGRLYDDARLAGVYQAGNEMPETSLRAWTELIGSFSPRPAPAVVEIGCGTGMFCAAMARLLPVSSVVGVDASAAMLVQADRFGAHPQVRYLRGTAEAVPTSGEPFDLALLSRVIHHLPDRRACARELARILRPDGVVVVRTTFRENLDAIVYRYWPALLASDAERFPGRDEVLGDFASAGFSVVEVLSFAQPVTTSLRDYHARMSTRPQSKFVHLTEREFRAGLELLEADAAVESSARPTPVGERYDVAVLARGSREPHGSYGSPG
ncbi:class I SAM-dependent methyltransferase [Streptomyces sp. SID3343]|uniref:class I SAM-dependent methyltransferase n=1 Tax=Streptomyces sp. SID3343 TaxID=2690260 RepID=UPI00136E6E98|nr:class I SAM-dependent methyltransferase [Streptomyces sp. SID3343]MYW01572.1 methyltransferase domain-containing protein [Streptomyces sp. SID3343]